MQQQSLMHQASALSPAPKQSLGGALGSSSLTQCRCKRLEGRKTKRRRKSACKTKVRQPTAVMSWLALGFKPCIAAIPSSQSCCNLSEEPRSSLYPVIMNAHVLSLNVLAISLHRMLLQTYLRSTLPSLLITSEPSSDRTKQQTTESLTHGGLPLCPFQQGSSNPLSNCQPPLP